LYAFWVEYFIQFDENFDHMPNLQPVVTISEY